MDHEICPVRGRLSCSRVISLWWPKDPMVLSHSFSSRRSDPDSRPSVHLTGLNRDDAIFSFFIENG